MKLSYWGYGTPFGGYGIANIQWIKHLSRLGVDVYFHGQFAPQPGTREWQALDDEERALFEKPFEVCNVGLVEATPWQFHLNRSKIKIANTMAEADKLGPDWVKACNGMDRIIVPNEFYKQVFRGSGVSVPITVIPHGVDTDRYGFIIRRGKPIFTFGSCGYLNDRKGALELIQAFASEFDQGEPIRLRLHSTNGYFGYYKYLSDPRIEVTTDLWHPDELVKFYHDLDCFVFPSRAEGVGYPPREAMSTGLPVILMNYSGLSDVASPDFSYPLEPDGFEDRPGMLEQPGKWARIDIPQIMYWMRYVYQHKGEAKTKGIIASQIMRQKYAWPICAKRLKDYLENIEEQA
ncbi:glycosyltransferase family 4 protein [Candidatus Collierbacteria bacterium]|nr:glycosyltransferase family 4 protein [Candidatus Collierbacteria bacterium]